MEVIWCVFMSNWNKLNKTRFKHVKYSTTLVVYCTEMASDVY